MKIESEEACHEAENLSTMSLLELPIITDIEQDEEVTKLIVSTHHDPSTSSVTTTAGAASEGDYMIIGHGTETELSLGESSKIKNEASHPSEAEHAILWGCKQCDFRFVEKKVHGKKSLAILIYFSFYLKDTH